MVRALCPNCDELIEITPNGADPRKTNKRQRLVLHPNKQAPGGAVSGERKGYMSRIVDDDPPIKTKAASQAYRDNWDRIFGDGPEEREDPDTVWTKIAPADHDEPTIGQYPDGKWYWLDETWNYGDDKRYDTYEEALAAQDRYCTEYLGH